MHTRRANYNLFALHTNPAFVVWTGFSSHRPYADKWKPSTAWNFVFSCVAKKQAWCTLIGIGYSCALYAHYDLCKERRALYIELKKFRNGFNLPTSSHVLALHCFAQYGLWSQHSVERPGSDLNEVSSDFACEHCEPLGPCADNYLQSPFVSKR